MSLPGGWELVLVVLVIMVLFGAKRLPDASRSLGRSLRIFKAETKGLRDDDKSPDYDSRDADRASYDRQIGSATAPPPPAAPPSMAPPSMTPPTMTPPPVSGESTDPAQPRQP
ncbi:MAG: Sec-independent protein translocase subunit TatA [Frankiaceae bacterium]|nr:Sec-independent protein translocase subunit TatA [Frankiaceae bacterium]